MRVLYIIDSLRAGGKERRLLQLLKGLLDNNIENIQLELVIMNKEIHYQEVFELDIPLHFISRTLFKDINIIKKFFAILKAFNPDLVHCWDNIAAIHFAPLCRIGGVKFINSMISAAPPRLSIFSKRYLSNAISYPFSNIILANSRAGLSSFRVPLKKARFIHNGFDFDRIKRLGNSEEIRDLLGINTEYVVGMVASFSRMKDYKTYFEAAKIIIKMRSDVTFLAVGYGSQYSEFHGNYSSDRIIFVGNQKEVEPIVNLFTIGILATYSEGISNSIMEYMALKKPVIASNCGGTSELIVDGETGFLIEPMNPKQLAIKIDFLLSNLTISKQFGKNGKDRILEHFSINKMVLETYNLYQDCLGPHVK